MLRYIDPEVEGVHPLRLELGEDGIEKIMQGIFNEDDWMSLEEIEAAHDYLYDTIASKLQTHEGVTTLQ